MPYIYDEGLYRTPFGVESRYVIYYFYPLIRAIVLMDFIF